MESSSPSWTGHPERSWGTSQSASGRDLVFVSYFFFMTMSHLPSKAPCSLRALFSSVTTCICLYFSQVPCGSSRLTHWYLFFLPMARFSRTAASLGPLSWHEAWHVVSTQQIVLVPELRLRRTIISISQKSTSHSKCHQCFSLHWFAASGYVCFRTMNLEAELFSFYYLKLNSKWQIITSCFWQMLEIL